MHVQKIMHICKFTKFCEAGVPVLYFVNLHLFYGRIIFKYFRNFFAAVPSLMSPSPTCDTVSHYFSHPVDVVHLQLQQYNDALINVLTHALKKINACINDSTAFYLNAV